MLKATYLNRSQANLEIAQQVKAIFSRAEALDRQNPDEKQALAQAAKLLFDVQQGRDRNRFAHIVCQDVVSPEFLLKIVKSLAIATDPLWRTLLTSLNLRIDLISERINAHSENDPIDLSFYILLGRYLNAASVNMEDTAIVKAQYIDSVVMDTQELLAQSAHDFGVFKQAILALYRCDASLDKLPVPQDMSKTS